MTRATNCKAVTEYGFYPGVLGWPQQGRFTSYSCAGRRAGLRPRKPASTGQGRPLRVAGPPHQVVTSVVLLRLDLERRVSAAKYRSMVGSVGSDRAATGKELDLDRGRPVH